MKKNWDLGKASTKRVSTLSKSDISELKDLMWTLSQEEESTLRIQEPVRDEKWCLRGSDSVVVVVVVMEAAGDDSVFTRWWSTTSPVQKNTS